MISSVIIAGGGIGGLTLAAALRRRGVHVTVFERQTELRPAGDEDGLKYYLMTISDNAGNPLEGKNTYRLTVPADAPVEQYWSATAYDRETHALVRGVSRNSRASTIPDLQKNADGSVDVYFAPAAPAGKETNLVPTDPQRQFEILFRFYGPRKPLFEKSWVLPDVAKMSE